MVPCLGVKISPSSNTMSTGRPRCQIASLLLHHPLDPDALAVKYFDEIEATFEISAEFYHFGIGRIIHLDDCAVLICYDYAQGFVIRCIDIHPEMIGRRIRMNTDVDPFALFPRG